MQRATAFAQAFVNAAIKSGGQKSSSWVARNVADKAMHTKVGVKTEKSVHVSCSARTRAIIMREQGVDVWA